jgi:signal transduction histidine kinase/putative methionine-R-sulfoxide reductase with GAF domain
LTNQLKKACKFAGAKWAAYLNQSKVGWELSVNYGLNKSQQMAITEFLGESKTQKWLDKAIGSQRMHYRTLKEEALKVKCKKVFAFSSKYHLSILLIGADQLEGKEREFFKVLALGSPFSIPDISWEVFPPPFSSTIGESDFQLNDNLQRILETMAGIVPADFAYLAIRKGDVFRVEAALNNPPGVMGLQINLAENDVLSEMVSSRKGVILEEDDHGLALLTKPDKKGRSNWLGMPIVLGTRVIGFAAYSQKHKYSESDLEKATALAYNVAPSIEKSIVYGEAASYLQKIEFINELASTVSTAWDAEEVKKRILHMLERTFRAENASILMLDSDKRILYEYKSSNIHMNIQPLPIDSSLEGSVVKIERPIRIGNIAKQSKYTSQDQDVESKLVVPFRYQGEVKGVLSLESKEIDAFSEEDEKLLVLVANQIAGIIENVRLNEEALIHDRNFMIINQIGQRLLGLNEISEIADVSSQMMAEHFGYEMVLVMLLDEKLEELVAEGVAGSNVEDVPKGFRYAKHLGVPGEVLEFGKSILIKNATEAPNYVPIPGWDPGSEMCVPLREGEAVFGVINVESQTPEAVNESDLLDLEAVAGVLSSVLVYARRYEQLHTNIRQLEAVRETSLDIGKDLDLEVLMKRVVNRVLNLIDARGAELGLVEDKEKLIRVIVSENPWQDYTGYTFPFMSGVAGRIAALGEPLAVADFNVWGGRKDSTHKAPFTTVAGVPLKLSGEVIGTLTVQDDRPSRAFGPEDIKTLELLAPQISIFIRNARLYQELEEGIEAQRLAEERLIRSARLAAIGEMAAAIAHELNNPLTTVTGFTELILESMSEDSPEFEDLTLVLEEAQRSRSVVRRLLDFSRQGEIMKVEADVNEVISMALALIHHIAQTSGIEIRVEMWDDLPLISIDRNQIQQVFLNLIHNAIQAMPNGGELLLQTLLENLEDGEWVAVIVKDTGVGISKEDLDKVFEPFFTTKPSGEGTGLGLSVSYSIVSGHGGHIDVESKKGKGSTFTVWLPVKVPALLKSE